MFDQLTKNYRVQPEKLVSQSQVQIMISPKYSSFPPRMSPECCQRIHKSTNTENCMSKEVSFRSHAYIESMTSSMDRSLERKSKLSNDSGRFSLNESSKRKFKKRASQIILEVPVAQLRKIKDTEGIGSIGRETKHFSETTTMHGPKRIYKGKRFSTIFWLLMVTASGIFLIFQVFTLVSMYVSSPTVSQVSFLINENGMEFPMVTLCNFNPIRKSYIRELNQTGDFSDQLLDYLMQALTDTQTLYGNADRAELHVGDAALQLYQKKYVNFTINGFFMEAGFECNEVMKMCSFGGRQFDCCKYMRPVLTNLGKCYSLDMKGSSKEWMHKQTSAGVNAGLQIILDAHMEEQFDGTVDGVDPIFSNAFENGYRYYVHAAETIPTLVSEGISVSPSTRVYSAITTNRYILLSSDHWGNCTEHWPNDYSTTLPYSSVNCDSLCKARYFNEKCRCTPFTYNIDGTFNLCSPYQTFQCIDQHIRRQINGTDYFHMPACNECKIECNSLVYHAYNSYGHGFSNGAIKWLNRNHPEWSKSHMKSNFLTVNVFFRDMSHTEYTQVQATSLTEILSNIGGNMGMFLGMSLITVTEIILYISKICWIAFSKKRRDYMFEKRKNEVEREKQLEETVSGFNLLRGRKDGIKESSPSTKICTLEQLSEDLQERDKNNQFCQTKEEPVERPGRIPSVISVPTVINSHEQYQQCGQIMNICDYKAQSSIVLNDVDQDVNNGSPLNVKRDDNYQSKREYIENNSPISRNRFYLWEPPTNK